MPILHNIDLEVQAGETVSVMGPSGSGKTSLLMVIAGVEQVTSGRVEVCGCDITGLDEDRLAEFRRHHIGVVFQNFHLIPTMTALENVALALELAGDADAQVRAGEALDRVGLSQRLHHYPAQLSGGEQQRVALARAFVTKPKLLLADEPTGNLDSHTGQRVIELLFEMKEQSGTTLLLITHDAELARRAGRILHMQDGVLA